MSKTVTLDRVELVKFIHWQFSEFEKPNGDKYHYGKAELKDLMDKIFGEPPQTPEEEIGYQNKVDEARRRKEREELWAARLRAHHVNREAGLEILRKEGYIK